MRWFDALTPILHIPYAIIYHILIILITVDTINIIIMIHSFTFICNMVQPIDLWPQGDPYISAATIRGSWVSLNAYIRADRQGILLATLNIHLLVDHANITVGDMFIGRYKELPNILIESLQLPQVFIFSLVHLLDIRVTLTYTPSKLLL